MQSLKNAHCNGNNGTLWVNGMPVVGCTKSSIIKKIKYEEVPAQIGAGTVRIPVSHTIEVSFSFKKTGQEKIVDLMSDDISLIIVETNIAGVVVNRVKASNITLDEHTLVAFEKNKVGEVEFSGYAETYQILQ